MSRRIGIMGGTFNPVHVGHLMLAEEAKDYLRLDEIIFMPSGISYMKQSGDIPSGRIRAHMTALAIENNPCFSLSMMEVNRSGPTYTYETIEELKKEYPGDEFYFLMGTDSFFSIRNWKNPDSICANSRLIVAVRGNTEIEQLQKEADYLRREFDADITMLPDRHIDISSTEIRERVKAGHTIRYMVPDNVLNYINETHLY